MAAADRSACAARSREEDVSPVSPPTSCHPLVGRDRESDSLVRELTTPGRRILSVVGAPGVGKSRLALEVADRVHRMAQVPVLWATDSEEDCINPGSYRPGELGETLRTVSRELFGCEDSERRPAGLEALVRAAGDRPTLLVLDAPQGDAPVPAAFDRLLADCPELRVLVTGRKPLGLPGERVVPLQPLDAEHALRALFAHTGQAPERDVDAAPWGPESAEICRLLDGLPGALVAAASWLAVYDQATLLSCLRENPRPFLIPLPRAVDGGQGCAFSDALDGSSRWEKALLDLLCTASDGKSAGELARVAGLSPAESGWALNNLVIRGLVLRETGAGTFRFRVLNLVRALSSTDDRVPAVMGRVVSVV